MTDSGGFAMGKWRWPAWQIYLAFSTVVVAVYYAFPADGLQAVLVGTLGM